MSLTPGARLGPYDILGPLGAGGMGEVFRARDARLGREVAIKVLPAALAADAERLARFTREAQTLAALNHPHIAQIYGFEDTGGAPALVMELVEGPTLADRIAQGAIPWDEVLPLARQLADALDYAHERGIVHRDFKPANIKVTPDAMVKVLDFGLAKAFGTPESPDATLAGTGANSPTITSPAMTQAGVILGTAAYMSPEQARGRPVDKRADIWAFGVVLYEMLTGRDAFPGESITDVLGAIVLKEPEWSRLPADAPPRLTALLRRCLEKDPRMRLRDIGEVRITLADERPDAVVAEVAPPPTVRTSPRRMLLPWSVAALAIVAAAVAWFAARGGTSRELRLDPALEQVTADAGLTIEPAVPPNGSLLAYASDRGGSALDIWVQPLPAGDPVQVTHDPADDREPNFSPDGSTIVFRSDRDGGGIYTVPALGGAERLVVAKGRRPRFSPDGTRIAYQTGGRGASSELWVIDAAGGAPRRLATDLKSVVGDLWTADGSGILVFARGSARDSRPDLWRVDPAGGPSKALGLGPQAEKADIHLDWAAPPTAILHGDIVFSYATDNTAGLWAVPVSADGRARRGRLYPLTHGTRLDDSPAVANGPDGPRLFFASSDMYATIHELPVDANGGRAVGDAHPLTESAARDTWPSVSRDGGSFTFLSSRHNGRVWLKDRASGRETSFPGETQTCPVLSPDGQYVACRTDTTIRILPTHGGPARVLPIGAVRMVWDWPTPSLIVAGHKGQIDAVDVARGTMRPLLADAHGEYYGHGRLSPDGRFVSAMEWVSADRARIIVFPFRQTPVPPSDWIAVTDSNSVAEESAWSPNSAWLYFVSERDGYRCIWAQRLDPATKHPVGAPVAVAHLHSARRHMIGTGDSPQRLDLGPGGLLFSLEERRGNIWLARLATQARR